MKRHTLECLKKKWTKRATALENSTFPFQRGISAALLDAVDMLNGEFGRGDMMISAKECICKEENE